MTGIENLDRDHLRKAVEAVANVNGAIAHYNANCRQDAQLYKQEAIALARLNPIAFAALVEAKEPGMFVSFDKKGHISGQTQFFLVFPVHISDPDLTHYIEQAAGARVRQCKIHLR
jgi:hypothetical protein